MIAVLLLGLVPLVVLASHLPAAAAVGPGFVEGNLVAHYLAGAGLALLVIGILRDVRAEAAGVEAAEAAAGLSLLRPRSAGACGAARPAGGAAVTPLVSVLTRDAGRTIETCLRSIRAQTWPALELIVVDNGSTDATWAVARRHADLVLRGGPERSAQRNLGIDHAAGEWVYYVDADMELAPTWSSGPSWPGRPTMRSGWPSPRSRSAEGSGPAAGPGAALPARRARPALAQAGPHQLPARHRRVRGLADRHRGRRAAPAHDRLGRRSLWPTG